MSTNPTTFKVKCLPTGEMRRFNACKSFDELQHKLITYWGKHSRQAYVLSYYDEDNDRIHVTSNEDFHEALFVAKQMGSRVLKFDAAPSSSTLTSSAPMTQRQNLICSIQKGTNLNKTTTETYSAQKYETLLSIYRKMLQANVPWGAVKQRMQRDGYVLPPKYDRMLTAQVSWDAVMNQMNIDGIHSLVKCNQSKPVIPEVRRRCTMQNDEYQELPPIYSNMLSYGVPWNAVVTRMKRDGYETCKFNQQERSAHGSSCRPKLLHSIRNGKKLRITQRQHRQIPSLSRVNCYDICSTKAKLKPTQHNPRAISPSTSPMSMLLHAQLPSPSSNKRVSFGNLTVIPPPRPRSASEPLPLQAEFSCPPPPPPPPQASPVISMSSEMVDVPFVTPLPQEMVLPQEITPHQYPVQLDQLELMGFSDRAQNIALLSTHQGSVELVVNSLIAINM